VLRRSPSLLHARWHDGAAARAAAPPPPGGLPVAAPPRRVPRDPAPRPRPRPQPLPAPLTVARLQRRGRRRAVWHRVRPWCPRNGRNAGAGHECAGTTRRPGSVSSSCS